MFYKICNVLTIANIFIVEIKMKLNLNPANWWYVFELSDFLKSQASVDTLEFLLYLFLQQVHKISLRSSMVAGEEYP